MILTKHAEYWNKKAGERIIIKGDGAYTLGYQKKFRALTRLLSEFVDQRDRILEIGGGTCDVAVMLSHKLKGIKYKGVDISDSFVTFQRKILKLDSVVGSAHELPFEDESFDCVWFLDVLEHIPPYLRLFVRNEVSRVLVDDGAVFINNPTFESKHDQDFEWLMEDRDILNMFAGFRIHQKTTYMVETAIHEFFVLTRKYDR